MVKPQGPQCLYHRHRRKSKVFERVFLSVIKPATPQILAVPVYSKLSKHEKDNRPIRFGCHCRYGRHLCRCFTIAGRLQLAVSIRLRTTCIFDSKLKATCSSWPKLGQVDSTWFVLPTCLAGVPGELHGCSRSRVSGAGYPPSIHVD